MNTKEYEIEIVSGHIIVKDDRGSRLLVDTGSPSSFHKERIIALGDETFSIPASIAGVGSNCIESNVGGGIDGLVGMDILGDGLLIDVPHGLIAVGYPSEGMTAVPSKRLVGCVAVEMIVRGCNTDVIIDTGAPTSYFASSFTAGLPVVGHAEDFSPLMRESNFETPLFYVPVSFAGQEYEIRAGNLPEEIMSTLSFFMAGGIVGMELLKHRRILIARGMVYT